MVRGGAFRICVVMGTRAEAIKLAPVVRELEKHRDSVQTIVVVTAQHREMLAQALSTFGITPQVDLGLLASRSALADFTARALLAFTSCFTELRPDIVIVQGDNTTVLAVALAAHYLGIPVAHLDAGLRSDHNRLPFPEQLNRRLAAVVSDLHFATTPAAKVNLLREGVAEAHIVVAGNTIIDAIRLTPSRETFDEPQLNLIPWNKRRVVLVTMHRRESLGEPLSEVCLALRELAAMHADLHLILPVHLNPRVRDAVFDELEGVPRIELVDPLGYGDMLEVLRRSEFVMTDSGGVQEECAALLKPVLILRSSTDRPEVIESGVGKLVGTDPVRVMEAATRLLDDARELARMSEGESPYGYGLASVRIIQRLLRCAPRNAGGSLVAEGPAPLPPRYAVEP
jgi:UDP-N-acetylglucosamine 2-epimerase (non-hydrolysing)